MYVIGTAGHVDHGKSTLVRALTGIDPDRLAEEKAREMTIDLGFAWLTLDDNEIGIVDVPGHRDFIENMLAGVGGIDLALFVIAADEGVMPQTREHLAILDLLQIESGIVALTKRDLIDDPDWLELVTLEIGEVLEGTVLSKAPIIPVSARTGFGIEDLKGAITQALRGIAKPVDLSRPRLPIDRIFSLPGFGTIVTGTLIDGSMHVGDDVEVQPGGLFGRVRGLQTHKTKRNIALPGSRVAVNLAGVDRDELRRGQVVTPVGNLQATHLIDANYRQLATTDSVLAHNEEVKLFVGSAEVTARVRIIGGDNIPPGAEGWIQLALATPVATLKGDRFILRRPSPGSTLGGGQILDPHPGRRHRRFRPDVLERLRTVEQGTPEELIVATLGRHGPLQQNILFDKAGLSTQAGTPALERLIEEEAIIELNKTYITVKRWQDLIEQAVDELGRYHDDYPLRIGIEREELRARLGLSPIVFNPLREHLIKMGLIAESGVYLKLPDQKVHFSLEQESAISRLMEIFHNQGAASPNVKECKTIVGDSVYFALVDLGQIKQISDDVVYPIDLYNDLIEALTLFLNERGSITASEARDLLATSRKYTIALLEHMDELRITRRSGDIRIPARPIPT